jgi:hypothetical protein
LSAIQTVASLTAHGRWRDPLTPKPTRVGLNLSFANDCDPEGQYLTDRSLGGRFTEVDLRDSSVVVDQTIEGIGLRRTAIDGVKRTLGAPQ